MGDDPRGPTDVRRARDWSLCPGFLVMERVLGRRPSLPVLDLYPRASLDPGCHRSWRPLFRVEGGIRPFWGPAGRCPLPLAPCMLLLLPAQPLPTLEHGRLDVVDPHQHGPVHGVFFPELDIAEALRICFSSQYLPGSLCALGDPPMLSCPRYHLWRCPPKVFPKGVLHDDLGQMFLRRYRRQLFQTCQPRPLTLCLAP